MAFYPYLLLALSGMGMASNVVSLFFFARQRFRRNFHRLLVILAIYDFMVGTFSSFKFHLLFVGQIFFLKKLYSCTDIQYITDLFHENIFLCI